MTFFYSNWLSLRKVIGNNRKRRVKHPNPGLNYSHKSFSFYQFNRLNCFLLNFTYSVPLLSTLSLTPFYSVQYEDHIACYINLLYFCLLYIL